MTKAVHFKGKSALRGKKVLWESVFPVGTRHGCERCTICCGGRVELSPKDVQSFKSKGIDDSMLYLDSASQLVDRCIIKQREGGGCTHLEEGGLCSIYKDRPLVCRSYPIMVTPGFENNLVVDMVLRCPFIGSEEQPEITKSDVQESIKDHIDHIGPILENSLQYRKTLADHIRIAYEPAFIPRASRLAFMDRAIDLLKNIENPVNMVELLRDWSDRVSLASHETLVRTYAGRVKGAEQSDEILSKIPALVDALPHKVPKDRWKNVLGDLNNVYFFPGESVTQQAYTKPRLRGIKVGDKLFSWKYLSKLSYSDDALDELTAYMRILVRRATFELVVAYLAEYIVDYKKMAVVDYSLESMILSNAMIVYLDPLARIAAAVSGNDQITGSDLRTGINNMDNQLLHSMANGVITAEMLSRIDGLARGYKMRLAY